MSFRAWAYLWVFSLLVPPFLAALMLLASPEAASWFHANASTILQTMSRALALLVGLLVGVCGGFWLIVYVTNRWLR